MKRSVFIGLLVAGILGLVAAGVYAAQTAGKSPRLSMAKPVIYLYTPTNTQVELRIDNVDLDTDIPTYKDKWLVAASPSGIIRDLQPHYTDCMNIDSTRLGLEYARNACKKNEYPYIYWAGKSKSAYPMIDKGWIVKKPDVTAFLNEKLSDLGLSSKEKFDMMEYWVPLIQKHEEPYFRIAFLGNKEMDELAPLTLNPAPDTKIRVFLDYLPLKEAPRKAIEPQQLEKVATRSGFVMVEWGGLKR